MGKCGSSSCYKLRWSQLCGRRVLEPERERHARRIQQERAGRRVLDDAVDGRRGPPRQTAISGWSRRPGTRTSRQVRTLLNQHADVNVRSDDGSTALLWAAHWNDLATADLLIRAGADANAANDFRITPLSLACTNGSAALVELLLKAGANPNTPIATGETPLMTCASSGNADAVRMLIARGADVNAKEPSQNQTALMWAAAERHPDVVRTLDRGRRRSSGPHEKGIHRAALRGAGGRPGEHAAVAGRGREREHPVAAGARGDGTRHGRRSQGRTAAGGGAAAPREVRPIRRRCRRAARRCSWPR